MSDNSDIEELEEILEDYRTMRDFEGRNLSQPRIAMTNARLAINRLVAKKQKEAVSKFITKTFGQRCKTKDTDDFPEMAAQSRCPGCEIWEEYDKFFDGETIDIYRETLDEAAGALYRKRTEELEALDK